MVEFAKARLNLHGNFKNRPIISKASVLTTPSDGISKDRKRMTVSRGRSARLSPWIRVNRPVGSLDLVKEKSSSIVKFTFAYTSTLRYRLKETGLVQ
jgi:hypothetical protein